MRFKDFKLRPQTESELDEVKQSPGRLMKFATGPAAEGMMAGFEAELIFADAGGEPQVDREPDYDADERPYNIRDIINFFSNDDFGYGIGSRGRDRLEEALLEELGEWLSERADEAWAEESVEKTTELMRNRVWDEEEYVTAALEQDGSYSEADIERILKQETEDDRREYKIALMTAEKTFEDEVEEEVENEGRYYDKARDVFLEEYADEYDDGDFVRDTYRSMSDVAEQHGLDWPVWTSGGDGEGGFTEDAARAIAQSFQRQFDELIKVGSGYHSASRTAEHWIFEADSSIHPNNDEDLPVEIISPPMPLKDCLEWLPKFFNWARDNDAYANESTGFHMSVSLPEHTKKSIDTIKLAMFLGDQYVLEQFGRAHNTYTESFLARIQKSIEQGLKSSEGFETLFADYDKNLKFLAGKLVFGNPISNAGLGKYFSINPKSKYIEFRSAGGENYFKDTAKLQATLARYAHALSLAADPEAEKKAYMIRLYKALSVGNTSDVTSQVLSLFTEYSTGQLTGEGLRNRWLGIVKSQTAAAPKTSEGYYGDYFVTKDGKVVKEYPRMYGNAALKAAMAEFGDGAWYTFIQRGYEIDRRPDRRQELAQRLEKKKQQPQTQAEPASDKPRRYLVGFVDPADRRSIEVDAVNRADAIEQARERLNVPATVSRIDMWADTIG